MTYFQLVQILPMLVVFLFLFFFLFSFRYRKYKKLIYKLFWNIFLISFSFILLFAFFYLFIVIKDIEALRATKSPDISLDNLSSIITLKPGLNGESYNLFLLNLFAYSAAVFFHVPFHFQVVGPGQIIVVIEGIIGFILPLIIIIFTLKNNGEKKEEIELLKIYLNRGWSILRVKKSSINDVESIEILSPDKAEIEMLFLSKSVFLSETINHFSIKWEAIDLDMIPYFARAIEEPLRQDNYESAHKANMFFFKKNKIDENYLKEFYDFLLEIQYFEKIGTHYKAICRIIDLLKMKLETNIENNTNENTDDIIDIFRDDITEVKPDE